MAPAARDTAAAAALAGISLWAMSQYTGQGNGLGDLTPLVVGIPASAFSILATASAAYGYQHHTSCSADEQRDDRTNVAQSYRSECELHRLPLFILATQEPLAADRERRLRAIDARCTGNRAPESRPELLQIAFGAGASGESSARQLALTAAGAFRAEGGVWLRAVGELGISESNGYSNKTAKGPFVRAGGGLMVQSCDGVVCGLVGLEVAYQRQSRPDGYNDGPSVTERFGVQVGGPRWRVELAGEYYGFNHYRDGRLKLGFGLHLALVVPLIGGLTASEVRLAAGDIDVMWERIIGAALAATVGDCVRVRQNIADLRTPPLDVARAFESDPAIRACLTP